MTQFKGSREAFAQSFTELAQEDKRVVLVSSDSVKAMRASSFIEKNPSKYFEAGISEQNAVDMAAGLASYGLMPFVATYAGFITMRACEQMRTFVAYPGLNVKFIGANGGLIGGEREGVTHQFFEDIGIVRSIPGITVVVPSDPMDVYQAVKAVAEIDGPAYVRIGSGREVDIFDKDTKFELGKIRILKKYGTDVAMFANSFILDRVIKAAELLDKEGIKATVVEVHTLKPIDTDGIVKVLDACGTAITVEDHNIIGGLGSAIAEVSVENRPTHIVRVGLQDKFPESGPANILADHYGMSVEDIMNAAKKAVNK